MELFGSVIARVTIATLCVWGILAIFGVSLGFWPLVGVGALVAVLTS